MKALAMNHRERLVQPWLYGQQACALAGIPRVFGGVGVLFPCLLLLRGARPRHVRVRRLFGARPDPLGSYRGPEGS